METLGNERTLAARNKNNSEDHPRKNQARNTISLRNQEDNITQVSKDIKSRATEKLSQDFSRTDSRILGALSKLDEFPLKPQFRNDSGPLPETYRKSNKENLETNEDFS